MMDGGEPTPGLLPLLRLLRRGGLDPAQVISASQARARACEPWLHAFAHLPEHELHPAPGGPLAGIAVGLKDIIDTADMPTRYGSPVFEDHRPERDAWVTARLRALGATILGKTVTTEFASRDPGPTVNPWNVEHTPGGSSSGSAAAVAAGIVPLALGSQTVGSTIRPAAFCGIVGLKPSFGAVPRTGILRSAPSLDHVGILTGSVDDAALALGLLAATDPSDSHGSAIPPFEVDVETGLQAATRPRIGLLDMPSAPALAADQAEVLRSAVDALRAGGAVVETFRLSAEFDDLTAACMTLLFAEAGHRFGPVVADHPDRTSRHLKDLVAAGREIPAYAYLSLLDRQTSLREGFDREVGGLDAILCPAVPAEAPRGLTFTGDVSFIAPWTFLGVPAVTLPAGWGRAGLPLAIQLVGRTGRDLDLLRVAKLCEEAVGFSSRRLAGPARRS